MKLLGLDPGLRHTGWGIVEAQGNRLSFVADGVIDSNAKESLAQRLVALFEGINQVIAAYQPQEAAVEETFSNVNPASTLKLGQARGVALLAPSLAGLPVSEYAATLVKKSIVGTGHADKAQIAHMVRVLLPGATPKRPDAADALAIAICHAHHRQTGNILARAAGGLR